MPKPQRNTHQTTMVRKEDAKSQWFTLDAKGKTLGRFASEVANILRGKHKPNYTPHVDTGDGVIILNADKISFTGAKEAQKIYYQHTGHIGGMRETTLRQMMATKPTYALWHAIKGMVPRTRLGRKQMRKLRLYEGTEHEMQAQQPVAVSI